MAYLRIKRKCEHNQNNPITYNPMSFDRMSEEISFFWYVDSLSKLFLENRLALLTGFFLF